MINKVFFRVCKFSILLPVLFFVSVFSAEASTLYFVPESRSFGIGQEFFVDVRVNTNSEFINAVQATINFPENILEVVETDKKNSVFNFWIDEPDVDAGMVSFIGGTAKGVSGGSLQILRIKFKAIGAGSADIKITEAVVTANDGKGTNVLSSIEETNIGVGTKVVPSAPAPILVKDVEKPVVVALPQKVERVAVVSSDLPKMPEVSVPFYPNQQTWYSHQGETIALWNIPEDITKVAVVVNGIPNFEPTEAEEYLFNGKNIGVLDEGIHYVHVQFKNNKGWGEVAHYKISIDSTSPMPFETKINSFVSSNPSPEIEYKNEDGLSGASHALIFIDDREPIRSTTTLFALPPQRPGEHVVVVRVFDNAGNSVEDDLIFEVLPLEIPVVEYITSRVSQDEFIFVSGKATPNGFVEIRISNESQEVFSGEFETDISGKWEAVIEENFVKGEYYLVVSARDSRGAVSYDSEPTEFMVKAKTIISFGFVELGLFEILVIIILLVLAGGGFGAWYYVTEINKREAYNIIANRDVKKLSKLLQDNLLEIEDLFKRQKKVDPSIKIQMKSVFKKMGNNIEKMKKYLTKEIQRLQ